MKILVTGGAGFIGSALVRYIINNTDYELVNVDKLTYAGNLESLNSIAQNKRYYFEQVDICNKNELIRVFKDHRPDKIMHLAAESHVDRSINSPGEFIQTNIIGTYNLLEVAREYWSEVSSSKKSEFKFHHISTDEVYGDLTEDEDPFTEESPYDPSSPYSASKASSDHLVRAWSRTYELPVVLSNCSNNYGPYQFPEKLIPLVINNAIRGKKLPIYGEGNQMRDWLYVDDHANALHTVLMSGDIGETYNIGSNNQKTNIDIVNFICDLLDELVPRKKDGSYRALISHIDDRPGHDFRYAINAKKITSELSWSPKETFESAMRKTVLWYLDNQEWCKRTKYNQ